MKELLLYALKYLGLVLITTGLFVLVFGVKAVDYGAMREGLTTLQQHSNLGKMLRSCPIVGQPSLQVTDDKQNITVYQCCETTYSNGYSVMVKTLRIYYNEKEPYYERVNDGLLHNLLEEC